MKKSIIFLLLWLGISGNSYATSWVKLSENGTSKLMLDKQSVLQQDALKKAWVKIEYKTPQANPELLGKEYNLAKLLWFFDCGTQKSATSQVFQYLDNNLIYSAGVEAKNAEFIEPVPESDVDIAMRHVCQTSQPAIPAKPMENKPEVAKSAETSTAPANPENIEKNAPKTAEASIKKPELTAVKTETKSVVTAAKDAPAKAKPSMEETHKTLWAYEGKRGPDNWGKLNREFVSCDIGQNQSPINIENTVTASLKPIRVIQQFPAKDILNNGHTVQVNFKEGNMVALDSSPYQLKYVHFHTPSENKIHDMSFPLEAQFVHIDFKGNPSVISVMFKEGKANPGLAKLWVQIPKKEGESIALKGRVVPSELMPENHSYYRFSGSLTTPPCSEGVRWLVMKTPMTASKEQIEAFEQAIQHSNNRPIQALNGRIVLE